MKKQYTIIIIGVAFFFQLQTLAQGTAKDSTSNIDSQTINEIDAILKQNSVDEPAESSNEVINKPMTRRELKKLNISDYSNMISDNSFNNYTVVQRNYMPKTARTQMKFGLTSVTNDVFYNNMGLNLGGTYHFDESWGVGLSAVLLSSSRNSDAKNIRDVQLVNIENLVTLKNTYGASVFFTPIYGKWSFANRKVSPFEIYIQAGIAQITNQSNLVNTAMTAGAGQLISLTRSSAIDINLLWYFYTTKNINNQDQSNNSMLLTVGYNLFWPKPNYR